MNAPFDQNYLRTHYAPKAIKRYCTIKNRSIWFFMYAPIENSFDSFDKNEITLPYHPIHNGLTVRFNHESRWSSGQIVATNVRISDGVFCGYVYTVLDYRTQTRYEVDQNCIFLSRYKEITARLARWYAHLLQR